jgi:hypothetical protein
MSYCIFTLKKKLGNVHNQSKKLNTLAIYNLFHDYIYMFVYAL